MRIEAVPTYLGGSPRPDNRTMIEKNLTLFVYFEDTSGERRHSLLDELKLALDLIPASTFAELLEASHAGHPAALIVGCGRSGEPAISAERRARALLEGVSVILVGEEGDHPAKVLPGEVYFGGIGSRGKIVDRMMKIARSSLPRGAERVSLLGSSPCLREVMQKVELYAMSDLPVLILGETGTGKELVAREIHARSARSGGPFVAINCSTIPDTLAESELFGTEKGAFTDAVKHRGAIARASGGTLFLDEIGTLSVPTQPRLLRVLESGEYRRLGSDAIEKSDFRLVCATCGNLLEMVEEGLFRDDLLYRISDLPIVLPPLRERGGDLQELARFFCLKSGKGSCELGSDAMEKLASYSWPGNVRELKSTIGRACANVGSGKIRADDITFISHLKEAMSKARGRKS